MHPELLQIGSFELRSYSLMVDLAILMGALVFYVNMRRMGLSTRHFIDIMIVVVLAGIIGARLYYVAVNWAEFAGDPLKVFRMWEGGLVLHGTIIASSLATFAYLRYRRISVLKVFDAGAPAALVAQAVGRIGCLLNGCCYGLPTDLPWGIAMPLTVDGVSRHPTALYELVGDLLVFALLMLLQRRRPFDGLIFSLYLGLYSFVRVLVEFWRGDSADMFAGLRVAQWVSIGLLVFALACLFACWWRSRKKEQVTEAPTAQAAVQKH